MNNLSPEALVNNLRSVDPFDAPGLAGDHMVAASNLIESQAAKIAELGEELHIVTTGRDSLAHVVECYKERDLRVAVPPSGVRSVFTAESDTAFAVFATRELADSWRSQFPASIGGGIEVIEHEVLGAQQSAEAVDNQLASFAADLAGKQTPLDADIAKILNDNICELYIAAEPETTQEPVQPPKFSVGDSVVVSQFGAPAFRNAKVATIKRFVRYEYQIENLYWVFDESQLSPEPVAPPTGEVAIVLRGVDALLEDYGYPPDSAVREQLSSARSLLATPHEPVAPPRDSEYTEGVCEDGAAILRDGQPITISEVLALLNGKPAPEPVAPPTTEQRIAELEAKLAYAERANKSYSDARDIIARALGLGGHADPFDAAPHLGGYSIPKGDNTTDGTSVMESWHEPVAPPLAGWDLWQDLTQRADALYRQLREAERASPEPDSTQGKCGAVWLGCSLPTGHEGDHQCGSAVWSSTPDETGDSQ